MQSTIARVQMLGPCAVVGRQVGFGDHVNTLIYQNRTWHRLDDSKITP